MSGKTGDRAAKRSAAALGLLPRGLRGSVTRMVNPGRHKHLRKGLDFGGFLAALDTRGAEYVILREPTGTAPPPELLIKDEHLPLAEDLVTDWPGGVPIKLFTPSARPGTGYQPPKANGHRLSPMPLFPVHRAERLIETGMANGKRVLDATDAFLARAYRAAYLQVEDWRHDAPDGRWAPKPELLRDLRALAGAAGIVLPETIAPCDLDAVLVEHGWRPPVDLLEKVSSWMPWLKAVLGSTAPEPPGLLAAFIRQRAVDAGLKEQIIRHFTDRGFDPLVTFDLSPEQRRLVETSLRGGNWRIGGFPTDAGPPTTLIIAHDLLPVPVSPEVRAEQPLCDDTRIIWAKGAIRKEVNHGKPRRQHYNPVHSSDNSKQAWHVVQLLMPEREQELRDLVEQRRSAFGEAAAGRDLTRGARARVELVEHGGSPAIRKTFRPGAERFMAREVAVMTRLAGVCPAIPKLLETGPGYLVREYVEGSPATHPWPQALPLARVREIAGAVRCCVAHGFDPIGLAPGSNMIFSALGVRFIDFEYWAECDPGTPPERAHCFAGLPQAYEGDRPPGWRWLFKPYPSRWLQHTALDLNSFLYDSAFRQRLKRSSHLAARHLKWGASSCVRQLRSSVARQTRRRLAR